jgi:hypothetical protein
MVKFADDSFLIPHLLLQVCRCGNDKEKNYDCKKINYSDH